MASENSFDIVSDFDHQELVNAVDQAQRDIQTRFDLKDTKTSLTLSKTDLTIETDSELTLTSIRDILETKALRRKLSLKIFSYGLAQDVTGSRVRQVITLQKGIDSDLAKKIAKQIRDQFPKIQPRIQGDTLRVTSKSRDELQAVMAFMREREGEIEVPLQFTNFR